MLWPKRLLEKFKRREKPSLGPELLVTNPENVTSMIVVPSKSSLCCPCLFRSRKPVDIKMPLPEMPVKEIVPIEAWGTPVLSMIAMDNDDDIATKSPPTSRTDSIKLSQDSLETHQISSGGNSDFSSDGENTMSPRSQDSPARLPNHVSVTNSPKHKNHHSNTNRMDTPVHKNSVPHRMEDVPIQRNELSTKMSIENMENSPMKKISFGSSQIDSGKSGKSHENERNTHESNMNHSSGKNSHASGMLKHENGRNSHENGRMTHESGRISYENGRMSHGSGNTSHESGKISHMSHENGFILHESTMMNGNVIMGRINGASHGYGNENGVIQHGMENRSSENSYGNKSGSHAGKDEMDSSHRSNPSTESPRRHGVSYGSPKRQSTMTNDSPRFKGVSISNVKPVTMSSPEKSNPSSSRTRSSGKRFISLESPGASDFEDAIQDNEDEIRRNQVYQKLQEDMKECGEIGNRERVSEHRLTKSQGDLSEGQSQRKKSINSAPHVKHPEDLDKFPMLGETPSPVESSPKLDSEPISTTPTGIASSQPNTPTEPTTPTENNEMALETIEESMPKNSTPPKPRPSLAKRRSDQMSRRESRESFNSRHSLNQDPNGAFKKPKEGMQDTMVLLESTDWESIMKGLKGLVRLVRFHKELVEGNLHSICVLLGRHIKNLRSQVARAACLAAADMFDIHKKAMEPELEELAGPLLQRTADTNRFLRADALKALDAMARQCSSGKVVQVLNLRGVHHHNGVVRCATARLFSGIVGRLGHEKFFALPKETRDKVIRSGAEMLTEGSLETRKHAKEMFTQLVPSGLLQRSLLEVVPPATLRHITKIIASLKIQI